MPYFPSISDDDRLSHVFKKFNIGIEKPLMQMHQVLMRRDDSIFSIAQREMIAAYVSGISDCAYCFGSHSRTAEIFGVEEGLFTSLLEDIDKADIDSKMKVILKFVKKLTIEPSRITQHDVDAVFNEGWDEVALYEAILVCCCFNFVNRLVMAIGLEGNAVQSIESAVMLRNGYDQIIEKFNLI